MLEFLFEFLVTGVVDQIYGVPDSPQPVWRRMLLRLLVLAGVTLLILPIRAALPVLLWLLWGAATLIMAIGELDVRVRRSTGASRWW